MSSTNRAYFESMYASDPDPWNFATSSYEQRKYAHTVAALPNEHFCNVFEPGCSIGVLTELLAPRCERLLATDINPGAHVIAVHWRGETDYPLTGDDAHAVIDENVKLSRVTHYVEEKFVLDLWVRVI